MSAPAALAVLPTQIPDHLKEIPQWVGWDWELRKTWTKPPINIRTGARASSTDPASWAPFGAAMRYARSSRLPGIGFVLTTAAGIVAVDVDSCMIDGRPDEQGRELIRRFGSYTERSPRGTGLHIFARGVLACKGRKVGGLEIYQAERYMTVTGHVLPDCPTTVEPAQEAIDWLLAYLGPAPELRADAWTPQSVPPAGLRERAACARIRRDTLGLLDTTGPAQYPSASEADSAICCALIGAGFTSDETLSLIQDSVRGSDMGRRKGRHADAYLRRTVEHAAAFASPVSVYGIAVQAGNGSRSIRGLTRGSHNSHIRQNGTPPEETVQRDNFAIIGPNSRSFAEIELCDSGGSEPFTLETTPLREYANNANPGGV